MLRMALLANEQWPECGETGAGSVGRCDELKPAPLRQPPISSGFAPPRDIETIESTKMSKHAGIGAQAPIGVRREARWQIAWCDRDVAGKDLCGAEYQQ